MVFFVAVFVAVVFLVALFFLPKAACHPSEYFLLDPIRIIDTAVTSLFGYVPTQMPLSH